MSRNSAILTKSPVLYPRLGEAAGLGSPFTAVDSSGNSHNGTYSNSGGSLAGVTLGVAGAAADSDTAAQFTGNPGRVDFGTIAALNAPAHLSVVALVQYHTLPSSGNYAVIASHGYDGSKEGWAFYIDNTSGTPKLRFNAYTGSANVGAEWAFDQVTDWPADTYAQVGAGYYGGTTWLINFNGVNKATGGGVGPQTSTAKVSIGAEDLNGTWSRFFDGKIDDVSVFTTDLEAEDYGAYWAWTRTGRSAYVADGVAFFPVFGMPTFTKLTATNDANELEDGTADPDSFDPGSTFDADQWTDLAKATGAARYVPLAKHHDGFSLWPSVSNDYNITASAWYAANGNRNVLAEQIDKARAKGLRIGIYLSIRDMHWEAANPGFNSTAYTNYVKDQISELLGGTYGTIEALWTDDWGWSVGYTMVVFATVYAHIKSLQPGCLLVENNHEGTLVHTDIMVKEGGGVGETVAAGNIIPAEFVDTIRSPRWFWGTNANTPKDAATIAADIATNNGRNAAEMIDAPPDNTGVIPSAYETIMRAVGGDTTPPATPAGLSAVAGNTQITLTWTANGEGDLARYDLYRSTDNSTYTLLTFPQPAAASYAYNNPHAGLTITGLTNGQQYWFKLKARDYSGNLSGFSSAATATPGAPGLLLRRRRALAAA